MNKHLLNAVIDVVTFFANCDDDACDPDAAVRMLESIAWHMQQLTATQRSKFIEHCQELAAAAEDPEASEFLLQIPTNLGL